MTAHAQNAAPTPDGTTAQRFRQLVNPKAALDKVAGGFRFLEGPAWHPREHWLVFSDIPANTMFRLDAGGVSVFREPSGHANGNFYSADGTLFTCEHGTRRVSLTRPGPAGTGGTSITAETLAERFEGRLLNSPNDIVVRRDGTVWFTDPTYGLEGRAREQHGKFVFCLDPKTGDLRVVAGEGFDQPNGLCFSPDETRLYVADSGKPHHVRVFDVGTEGNLDGGRIFCVVTPGVPDGMRCDTAGNLWTTAGDGVQVFSPAGELLGKIPTPETPTNLCFGGKDGDELYVTAGTSLYRVKVARPAR